MRPMTLCSLLITAAAGFVPFQASAIAADVPTRLSAAQMETVTAGAAVIGTDAAAQAAGIGARALTSAKTRNFSSPTIQLAVGRSSALGVGTFLVATNSATAAVAGDGRSSAAIALNAGSIATGPVASTGAFTQALAVDSDFAAVAFGLAGSIAGGGNQNIAFATGDARGRRGSVVTSRVQVPGFSAAQATAFAISLPR